MKVKKGVVIKHPVNFNRDKYSDRLSAPQYIPPSFQKAILYHLSEGKFSFYFSQTTTGNTFNPMQDPEYLFKARDTFTGTQLSLTLEQARIYSMQTANLYKLYTSIKEELSKKRRVRLPEERVIEIGTEITSQGQNVDLYGERDRRMVAKSLLSDLVDGMVVDLDITGKVRLI